MGCTSCGKTVTTNGVRYCRCGTCCCCHLGWICPDGKFWWRKAGTGGHRQPYAVGQSHGGTSTPCNAETWH